MVSVETGREMMAAVQRIAGMARVHPYEVSIGIEPLEDDPSRPYWIVTVHRGNKTGQYGDADLETAARMAIENL